MSDAVLLTVTEGLARLTLNRPRRLNAFNRDLAHDWRDATREATTRDDVRAILIDASGPAFCAGGDVIDMASTMGGGEDLTGLAEVINEGIRALVDAAIPVVAAAHGTTAGGGLGILLTGDYTVVGSRSKIGSLYANIGLTPDLSVSAQLARAVGERRALQLVLQDRLIDAEEAYDWGLVAEVIAGTDAEDEADRVRARGEQIARFWLAGAAGAYGQAKRLIRSQPARSFAEQLSEEAHTIGASYDTPEAQKRIAAFAASSAQRTA